VSVWRMRVPILGYEQGSRCTCVGVLSDGASK